MRRFIASLPGKVLSHIVIAALIVPYIFLGLAAKASAQDDPFLKKKRIGVIPFVNKKDLKKLEYGDKAAEAVNKSFSRNDKFDIETVESVKRQAEALGLLFPITGIQNIVRLGEASSVDSVIYGEIIDYRVDKNGAGKQARVSMKLYEYDVVSSLAINGAAVSAASLVRSAETSDQILIEDALGQAANAAVDAVNRQVLRDGAILNTFERQALVNRGSRDGYKQGMEVIIKRGRQQVATGNVTEVTPDKSTIRISKSNLGAAPQDRVTPVFQVPNIAPGFSSDGAPTVSKVRSRRASSSFVTTLLIVGVIAFLVAGSGGRNGSATEFVQAEPYVDPTNGTAVKVSWTPNGYAKGNSVRQYWQVFRSDFADVPVRLANGALSEATDFNTATPAGIPYLVLPPNNFNICNQNTTNLTSSAAIPGVISGRPYTYQVQLVFALNRSDLLNGGSGGGVNGVTAGGTNTTTATSTTTTTTATTATTQSTTNGATTGTGNANLCYFVSERRAAIGLATPFARPALVSPANNATLTSPQTFSFNSVVQPAFPDVTVQYVLQISSTINFAPNTYIQRELGQRRETGTLTSDPLDLNAGLPAILINARTLYWRIGARNVADNPGPVPDGFTQQRFIFSLVNTLTRPGSPPPPPSN